MSDYSFFYFRIGIENITAIVRILLSCVFSLYSSRLQYSLCIPNIPSTYSHSSLHCVYISLYLSLYLNSSLHFLGSSLYHFFISSYSHSSSSLLSSALPHCFLILLPSISREVFQLLAENVRLLHFSVVFLHFTFFSVLSHCIFTFLPCISREISNQEARVFLSSALDLLLYSAASSSCLILWSSFIFFSCSFHWVILHFHPPSCTLFQYVKSDPYFFVSPSISYLHSNLPSSEFFPFNLLPCPFISELSSSSILSLVLYSCMLNLSLLDAAAFCGQILYSLLRAKALYLLTYLPSPSRP